MNASDWADVIGGVLKVAVEVAPALIRGDIDDLKKMRVDQILGRELMTSAAKRAADERARERLGGGP